MLLELGGKLPAPSGSLPVSGTEAAAPAAPAAPGVDTDVVAALVGLGWAEKASLAAVEKVRADREAEDAEERSEEHTSELQSRGHLVCRLPLEKKDAHT